MPRRIKQTILLSVDLFLIPFALWASFTLRLGRIYIPEGDILYLFIAAPVIAVPIFIRLGLYNAIIRYIGFMAFWAVIKAASLYTLTWGVLVLLTATPGVPRSVLIINWLMIILLVGGSRAIARWWLSGSFKKGARNKTRSRVAIYGAGEAGIQIASALSNSFRFKPVAFIDDNPGLQGNYIAGLRVYSFKQLSSIIDNLAVTEVLLALPSASRSTRSRIISMLEPHAVHVITLPSLEDLASGEIKSNDVREVGLRDLLGRNPVDPDENLLTSNITGKVVMVTGAGGSIGSELCRQILKIRPATLILYERSEHDLYKVESELIAMAERIFPDLVTNENFIIPILASVTIQSRVEMVCKAFGVQTIYHAAAYKHVPMVEKNPLEAIQNNILGTYKTAIAAIENNVETFVLISTDKAVRPTSTMGATKRFAEMVLQVLSMREKVNTRFSMVRFGNVLGSSGSVIPLFRSQIKNGGPVTVTDPKIIRYFMTTEEASQLVIQAGAMGDGGEVFVLDMGEPVKILDMAKKLIHLSGLEIKDAENPDGDIEIVFSGLRPGEKLYEELLIGENVSPTSHPLIMAADEDYTNWGQVSDYIDQLKLAIETNNVEAGRLILVEAVNGYSPQCDVADLVQQRLTQNVDSADKGNILKYPS
ncbi:MAG: polysaccharide biosynthesis protein [Cyclobacteriaceae bacterium]|nr:polysaccharide biosynthesis protein [Cyclobacteriaceae bacterium]